MEDQNFEQRLKSLLQEIFPGCDADLEHGWTEGRYGGVLVWDGFDDMEPLDRQRLLWKKLREAMPSPADQSLIAPILAMTPSEMAVIRED